LAQFRIEPLAETHIEGILHLEKLSNAAPWSETSFRGELTNQQAKYFVAFEERELVGFAGMWLIVDEAHVTNVAVHPQFRGRGLGKLLMVRLLDEARTLGMTCSTLEVRASNEVAIALYETLGYVRCGLRKKYYPNNREDAVVMWLYGLDKVPA